MKTLEQKAKAYDEAIEKAKDMLSYKEVRREDMEYLFPELKESEDEKIRKELIDFIYDKTDTYELREKSNSWLAWLEKQGEQKPNKVEPKFKVGDWIVTNKNHIWYVDKNPETTSYLYRLINQYDKVEVAEFEVVDNVARLWTIQDAKDGDVLCCESGWTCIFRALDNHTNTFSSYCFMDSDKWFCNTGCTCHTLDEQFIRAYNFKLHPATKEQRNLLFQKMKEAGYEWDADKKELKKIEQKSVWGEEDEKNINFLCELLTDLQVKSTENEMKYGTNSHSKYYHDTKDWLKSLKDRVQPQPKKEWSEEDDYVIERLFCLLDNEQDKYSQLSSDFQDIEEIKNKLKSLKEREQPKQKWSEEDKNRINRLIAYFEDKESFTAEDDIVYANWLKSLRPQNRWKPSDEQMDALHYVTNFDYGGYKATLVSLYEQLKKLKD